MRVARLRLGLIFASLAAVIRTRDNWAGTGVHAAAAVDVAHAPAGPLAQYAVNRAVVQTPSDARVAIVLGKANIATTRLMRGDGARARLVAKATGL